MEIGKLRIRNRKAKNARRRAEALALRLLAAVWLMRKLVRGWRLAR